MMSQKNDDTKPIDWQVIWQQLNWDDPQQQARAAQERLRQRARQYAKPKQTEETTSDIFHLLSFELGAERYCVDVSYVHGVRKTGRITRVPGAPIFYRGIVNVRGQIVSAMDIRFFFGIEAIGPEPDELLLVRVNNLQIGLLAHHISEVLRLPKNLIEPIAIHYAQGITRDKVIVLDLTAVFSDERLIVGGMDD